MRSSHLTSAKLPLLFAYAERDNLSGSGWLQILLCGGVLLGVMVVAMGPFVIAAKRQHRRREVVGVLAFWWGLVTAWSAVSTAMAQFAWNKEYVLRIMTGYFESEGHNRRAALAVDVVGGAGCALRSARRVCIAQRRRLIAVSTATCQPCRASALKRTAALLPHAMYRESRSCRREDASDRDPRHCTHGRIVEDQRIGRSEILQSVPDACWNHEE